MLPGYKEISVKIHPIMETDFGNIAKRKKYHKKFDVVVNSFIGAG